MQVLVLCASMPGFPSEYAAEYVKVHRPPVVLTDLNLGALTAGQTYTFEVGSNNDVARKDWGLNHCD